MSTDNLHFQLEGPRSEALASELSELVEAEFGERPAPATPRQGRETLETYRGPDPLAVTAVVLAVPGAILATVDLAERLKLKQKVDRLIAWAKEKLKDDTANRILLRSRRGNIVPLDRAETSQIFELAEERPND
jgi:hypothetical protein